MDKKISVKVCLGTTCFVMGSSNLQELIETVPKKYGDMVEVAGVGVAMANGRDELKAVADYITKKDNNNSGIAEVINEFFL